MMKKVYCLFIVLMIFALLSSCGSATDKAVISNDYSQITYNNEVYLLADYFMDIPDDAIEIDAAVENEITLPIIEYNDAYISNTYPNYIWLRTTYDGTANSKFAEVLQGNAVMYTRNEDTSKTENDMYI